jgi:hypothetical protein
MFSESKIFEYNVRWCEGEHFALAREKNCESLDYENRCEDLALKIYWSMRQVVVFGDLHRQARLRALTWTRTLGLTQTVRVSVPDGDPVSCTVCRRSTGHKDILPFLSTEFRK